MLNLALKYALVGLLTFERHWTLSGLEWCYAWLAFAAQLLNSAVVLLLVNCSQLRGAASFTVNGTAAVNGTGTVDVAGAGIGAGAVSAENEVQLVEQSSWFQYVMLSGQYSDFDQAWFETVGKSIWVRAQGGGGSSGGVARGRGGWGSEVASLCLLGHIQRSGGAARWTKVRAEAGTVMDGAGR